jgi:hypothetical protein
MLLMKPAYRHFSNKRSQLWNLPAVLHGDIPSGQVMAEQFRSVMVSPQLSYSS